MNTQGRKEDPLEAVNHWDRERLFLALRIRTELKFGFLAISSP